MCTMWMQRILLQKLDKNKTQSWQKYVFQTGVQQMKSSVEFYFLFISIGHKSFLRNFQPTCGPYVHPCVAHVHPWMNYELTKNEWRFNYELIKN